MNAFASRLHGILVFHLHIQTGRVPSPVLSSLAFHRHLPLKCKPAIRRHRRRRLPIFSTSPSHTCHRPVRSSSRLEDDCGLRRQPTHHVHGDLIVRRGRASASFCTRPARSRAIQSGTRALGAYGRALYRVVAYAASFLSPLSCVFSHNTPTLRTDTQVDHQNKILYAGWVRDGTWPAGEEVPDDDNFFGTAAPPPLGDITSGAISDDSASASRGGTPMFPGGWPSQGHNPSDTSPSPAGSR